MSNAELRAKALSKIKDKNFSLVSVFTYTLAALTLLAGDITGIPAVDVLISLAAGFIASIFCAAGHIRVAMGIWRQGKGGFRDMAGCITDMNTLRRHALPCVVYSAALVIFRHVTLSGDIVIAIISGIIAFMLHILACYGCYAVELTPDLPPLAAFGEGVGAALRSIGRILEMKFITGWWIAAIIAFTLYIFSISNLTPAIMGLIMFLILLIIRWMIGSFIALAEAGLARKILSNED